MNLVDLSHPINDKTPVYPGDPPVIIETGGQISKDGFLDHKVTFGTHVGTHIDAPAHMLKEGNSLSTYSVERFICPAVCIDARNGFTTEAIKNARIQPGAAVLFYTGASDQFHEEKYWHDYKVLSEECYKLLINYKVNLIGVDTGSVDIEENFPVHKNLLGSDVLIIENLNNKTKDLIGKRFELIAMPLKLEIDGAPARVVAKLL